MKKENTKRFVGKKGEFVPSVQPKKGTITIQYLEELLEWLHYRDNFRDKIFIVEIIPMDQKILSGAERADLVLNNPYIVFELPHLFNNDFIRRYTNNFIKKTARKKEKWKKEN